MQDGPFQTTAFDPRRQTLNAPAGGGLKGEPGPRPVITCEFDQTERHVESLLKACERLQIATDMARQRKPPVPVNQANVPTSATRLVEGLGSSPVAVRLSDIANGIAHATRIIDTVCDELEL